MPKFCTNTFRHAMIAHLGLLNDEVARVKYPFKSKAFIYEIFLSDTFEHMSYHVNSTIAFESIKKMLKLS